MSRGEPIHGINTARRPLQRNLLAIPKPRATHRQQAGRAIHRRPTPLRSAMFCTSFGESSTKPLLFLSILLPLFLV
uniref:Uncharacterized protein n=1 Tax=Arundo donax TaxID=35708 RepID=A0A0A9DQL3_ARUDO